MEQITGLPLELNIHNQIANKFIADLGRHRFLGVSVNALNTTQDQFQILPESIEEAKRQGLHNLAKDSRNMLDLDKESSEKKIEVTVWLRGDNQAQMTTAIDKIRAIAYENKVIKFPNKVEIKPNRFVNFAAKNFGPRPEDEDIFKLSATIELQF